MGEWVGMGASSSSWDFKYFLPFCHFCTQRRKKQEKAWQYLMLDDVLNMSLPERLKKFMVVI
jgi:hypothetical protein